MKMFLTVFKRPVVWRPEAKHEAGSSPDLWQLPEKPIYGGSATVGSLLRPFLNSFKEQVGRYWRRGPSGALNFVYIPATLWYLMQLL